MADNISKAEFVATTNRCYSAFEQSVKMSVWLISGTVSVGDSCFIDTDCGIIPVEVTAMESRKGNEHCVTGPEDLLLTVSGFAPSVGIPLRSIISSVGITSEQYAEMPMRMTVDATYDAKRFLCVVGKVSQGVLRKGTLINIVKDDVTLSARVADIESQFCDSVPYGGLCGVFLDGIPDNLRSKISEGTLLTTA